MKKVRKVIKPFAGLGNGFGISYNNLSKVLISIFTLAWKKKYRNLPQHNESLRVYTRGNLRVSTAANIVRLGYQASTFEIVSSFPLFVNGFTLNSINSIRTKL
ncbi:hypothetical protein Q5O89_23980 [Peribacillus frigoritolerans]|nr:hypothetical protein [Peribacillus frigoritolerans]